MKNWFTLTCIIFLLTSCEKQNFDEAPEIALEEIGPEQIIAIKDSIYMRISFYDANGDLGENMTNDRHLFVVDERLELAHEFRISAIVPGGAEVPIQGELEWVIPSVFITNTAGEPEDVTYRIYLFDREGNKSNTITTPAISIVP